MEQQVLELVKQLGHTALDEDVLELLCQCACQRLDRLLADGVSPADCGQAYPMAAAFLVLDWARQAAGGGDIVALAAGDLSVRREGASGGGLRRQALELMAPYLREEGFVFRGVRG